MDGPLSTVQVDMDIWATGSAGAVVLFSDFAVKNPKNTTSSEK